MKKIMVLLLFTVVFCTQKKEILQEETMVIPLELDRPRMEEIVILMPELLRKSEDFKIKAKDLTLSDQAYNTMFYQYLFEEGNLAQSLQQSGFENAEEYEAFYTVLIEMYLLLLEQPEIIDTAVLSIPAHEKEVVSLLLKKAQEPNNVRLSHTLERLQYELAVYKNLVLINAFSGQLNTFNKE